MGKLLQKDMIIEKLTPAIQRVEDEYTERGQQLDSITAITNKLQKKK